MNNFILQFKPFLSVSCPNGAIPQSSPPFDFKNVPWSRSYELLRHLAAHGTISWEGRKLIVDLFSKVPFVYEVTKTEKGELKLSGKLQDIPLADISFMSPGHPTWFIIKNQLKVISTVASWIELQKLPRIIDPKELQELIDEQDPPVHLLFEGNLIPDPLPLLVLTDRKGAFANLMMLYGSIKHEYNRNRKGEAYWEKDLLETGYIRKIVDQSHYYCPLDKVGKSIAFLLELGWKVQDANQNEVLLESAREIQCNQKMELSGHLRFGAFQADLTKVFGAFNKRERFIDLGEGKIGLIDESDPLALLGEEIECLQDTITLKKHHRGLLEDIAPPISYPPSPLGPSSFKGTLRPYQQEGVNWLLQLYQAGLNGILADEMGLGKTVQALAFLGLKPLEERHLIIVPTSLLFNWQNELKRFLPSLSVYRHHGPERKEELPDSGVILTSYHTLLHDINLFKGPLFHTIILDEAQVVKNPDSQIARALHSIQGAFKVAMTGTIIENHAKELFSHFHFLMPGMLGEREHFEKQLSLATVDSRYVKKIKKMIAPFILRRRKEEVVKDLPPLEEYTVLVEMPPSQRQTYDQFLAATKQGLLKKIRLEGTQAHRMEIFEALLRLRQIACCPLLVSRIIENVTEESGKLQALFFDLEAIYEEGKKALIFSQFASMLHLIGNKLEGKKIPFCVLEGATRDRETPVKRFQEDPSIPFFLLTLKAGGVGLNLTAADYVLLYDPWWHDAIDAQAISRAHRIGQTKPVIAKRYITQESIEEKMVTLKKAKSSLFNNLLDNESELNLLKEEDFLYLLD